MSLLQESYWGQTLFEVREALGEAWKFLQHKSIPAVFWEVRFERASDLKSLIPQVFITGLHVPGSVRLYTSTI